MIRTRWFINDTGGQVCSDPAAQLLETGFGVGELFESPVTQTVAIEFVFGNVYPNAIVCHLRHVLCLSSEAATSGIPSGLMRRRCAIAL